MMLSFSINEQCDSSLLEIFQELITSSTLLLIHFQGQDNVISRLVGISGHLPWRGGEAIDR